MGRILFSSVARKALPNFTYFFFIKGAIFGKNVIQQNMSYLISYTNVDVSEIGKKLYTDLPAKSLLFLTDFLDIYIFLLFVHVFFTLSMYSYCGLCILIVRPCILIVVYVFLLFVHVFLTLSMYSYCCLCILIVRPCILTLSMCSYCCLRIFIVRPCILTLSMFSYCSSMYSYCCLCILRRGYPD